MTNPTNKRTHEEFVSLVKDKKLFIEILDRYINTDTKIKYKCKHGEYESLPWQILKFKYCCRKGYYESGNMWNLNEKKLNDSYVLERAAKSRPNIDLSNAYVSHEKYRKIINARCTIHDILYDSIVKPKIGQCPECFKEDNREKLRTAAPKAWSSQSTGSFVSKKETKWLDELNIKDRQVWLEDVKYKVDGYDSETNTVYLYHGKFWHGCPKTFDPEMIHPIIKIPMKDLYEKTMYYENKLKQAGYNLVVKWGT